MSPPTRGPAPRLTVSSPPGTLAELSARAIILVAHGSPQPQWAKPAEAVRDRVRAGQPDARVELAFLPPAQPDLAMVLEEVIAAGARRIEVLALLLSSGGRHMQRDIPAMLETLRDAHPGVAIRLEAEALGASTEAIDAMASAAARLLDAE